MTKCSKKRLLELAAKHQDKYVSLLWYARSQPEDAHLPAVKEAKFRIEKDFTYEVGQLCDPETGDWQHGFHSGIVAMARYFQEAANYGEESADEQFPFGLLDS